MSRVTKNIDSITKPFAARVWPKRQRVSIHALVLHCPYNNSVIPSEYSQLIQSRDKIPARGDITGKEDAKGEDGDRVHEVVLSCSKDVFEWWDGRLKGSH